MSERVFLLLKFSFPQDGFTQKHRGKKKPCWYVLTCVVQQCWAVRISRACRMSGLILCFQEDAVIVFFAFDDLALEKFQCLCCQNRITLVFAYYDTLCLHMDTDSDMFKTDNCLKSRVRNEMLKSFWHICDLFVVAFLASDLSNIRHPRNAEGVIRQPCAPNYF